MEGGIGFEVDRGVDDFDCLRDLEEIVVGRDFERRHPGAARLDRSGSVGSVGRVGSAIGNIAR